MKTVPFAFVCFKINKAADLFLLVPLMSVNLSTDYTYQYNVDYQYVFDLRGSWGGHGGVLIIYDKCRRKS